MEQQKDAFLQFSKSPQQGSLPLGHTRLAFSSQPCLPWLLIQFLSKSRSGEAAKPTTAAALFSESPASAPSWSRWCNYCRLLRGQAVFHNHDEFTPLRAHLQDGTIQRKRNSTAFAFKVHAGMPGLDWSIAYLPSTSEALGPIPDTTKKKKKKITIPLYVVQTAPKFTIVFWYTTKTITETNNSGMVALLCNISTWETKPR